MNTHELVPLAAPRLASAPHRVLLPNIDPGHCTGCGRCIAACDPQLLSLETMRWKKSSVLHGPTRCTGCRLCARVCRFDAITMRLPPPRG